MRLLLLLLTAIPHLFAQSNNSTISNLTPFYVVAGQGTFTLTVDGLGFCAPGDTFSGSTVQFNSTSLPTAFVSFTRITATVNAALVTTPGVASVSVVNQGCGYGNSAPVSFYIDIPFVLSQVTPATIPAGSPDLTLTVTGTGFPEGARVRWNGNILSTTFVSADNNSYTVSAAVPAALVASPGTATITVSDYSGETVSSSLPVQIVLPTITALSPPSAQAGGPTFSLIIDGANFLNISSLLWNTTYVEASYLGPNRLSASIPAGLIRTPGSVTIRVQNPNGNLSQGVVFPITASGSTLVVTTNVLPNGIAGTPYSQSLAASGGSGSYTWSVVQGTPPAGLNLSSGGVIGGTPSSAGTAQFTVQVKDATGAVATKALTLTVDPSTLSITTASPLPSGQVGVVYSAAFSATGGQPAYTFSGAAPAGLTLSPSGVLSGTPSSSGTFNFTVTVTDAGGRQASKAFNLTVGSTTLAITTASPLPPGQAGVVYSASFAATGGQPPYTFSGSAPAGLALSSSGVLGGTPSSAGGFNFTVTVTDAAGRQASKAFDISIVAALVITTPSPLPAGTLGMLYTASFAATGGQPPYTFSGAAPAGLTLSSSGVLNGTPSSAGAFNFTVTVTDATGRQASKAFDLAIGAALAITTPSQLLPAQVGVVYTMAFAATGGQPPYTFSGAAPAGLTISSSGVLNGTPSAGDFNFTVTVTDAAGRQASKAFALSIGEGLTIITSSPLPSGQVGRAYSTTFTATGGQPPYSFFATPPAGLTMSSSGALSGTPTAAGNFNFGVTVRDAAGRTASSSFDLSIAATLSITTTSPLPQGQVGTPYSVSVQATGGTTPYLFVSTTSLPPGLSMSQSGLIAGTPTTAGPYTVGVTVSDAKGLQASRSFDLTISTALAITTASPLPQAVAGKPYTAAVSATGGRTPYTFSGTAPAGLTLSSGGSLSGTPPTAGSFDFTVTVTDAAGTQASKAFTLVVAEALAITTSSLPQGSTGSAYSATIAATGGRPPYTFSGDAPAGLSLSPAGVLSGTPSAAGSFTVTVTVADSTDARATRTLALTVVTGLAVSTTSLPGGTVGTNYSASLQATGGRPPYTFAGSPGAGLTVSDAGAISGSPTRPGTLQFTVTVTDASGARASRDLAIAVAFPATPPVAIGGVSDTVTPASQPNVTVSLGGAFPADIDGQVQLTFSPDVTGNVAANADDPSIQFSSGGRTLGFRIPAGSTQAQFTAAQPAIQTGTVAGTITLAVALQAADSNITPGTPPTRTIRVARAAPVITSVRVVRSATGFDVVTTGYATTREMTQAAFHFTPAAGASLQTTDVTVQVGSPFTSWYQSGPSAAFGSQFSYTQPFTVQGNAAAFTSISVTLTNPIGSSQPVSAQAP